MIQSAKASCPRCLLPLEFGRAGRGFAYACGSCGGQAVSTVVVRNLIGPVAYRDFWSRTRRPDGPGDAPCPLCGAGMSVLRFPEQQQLDFCGACQFVWLDRGERDELPPAPPGGEPASMPPSPEVERAIFRFEDEQAKDRANSPRRGIEPPDELWKYIPIVMGLPTEVESRVVLERPWVTWSLVAACGAVLAVTWNRPDVIAAFALVPAEPWRWHGATWITSAFLHAGLGHFLGNAYFLLVFGDNVEEDLGPVRFLGLYLAAGFAGNTWHALADPRGDLPVVGASGAISGVLVYYALKFPKHRLALRFYWDFVTLPAWYFVVFWMVSQLIILMYQLVGASNVSALGHLGGAAIGMLAWVVWRRRPPVGAWPR